jgi:hypothetical protein
MWRSPKYAKDSIPAVWLPAKIPPAVTNLAAFERTPKSLRFRIKKFIGRYGMPSRYLRSTKDDDWNFLIYDLPSGHSVALYVGKPPNDWIEVISVLTPDGSLLEDIH